MDINKAMYSVSKSLVKANPLLNNEITFIDHTGLETLIKRDPRVVLFSWNKINMILPIINNKKINPNSQFICIDKKLCPNDRFELSSKGIKFIEYQKFINIDNDKFVSWVSHDNYKILLVDDNIDEAHKYESTFNKSGIQVKIIHPDIEILESIKYFQPDLLLMVLNIDEIAADEFVKLIRSDPEYLILPIVFLSNETSVTTRQKVLDVGADEVLFHPIKNIDLTYKLISRMQDHYFQLLNVIEEIKPKKSIYHAVEDSEHSQLVKFITEAENDSATVIWLKINNKDKIQSKIGLSGFRNLCTEFLNILPTFKIDFLIKSVISEGFFVFASKDLNREQAKYWINNVHNWLLTNFFIVRKKDFSLNIQAFVLNQIPSKSNKELLIYDAQRLLINTKNSQLINYIAEGEDQKHFYLIKTKLENAIKARDFKWLFQSIINIHNDSQEIFQLMLKVLTHDGNELRSNDYINIANQTGLLRLLDRYTLEHAIKLIKLGNQDGTNRIILVNQVISDYDSDLHRHKILSQIKKQNLPEGRLIFQFRQDLTEEHTSLLSKLGKELRQANITICLSEFDATPMAWNIAKTLDVHWLRIKPFGLQSTNIKEQNLNYLGNVIKKAQSLEYKVMVTNIDSAKLTANIWKLNADYIHGNFIQSPVSDIKLLEGNL